MAKEKYKIDKSWLQQKYWTENLSMQQIAKLVGCNPVTILNYMRRLGVKPKNKSRAMKGRLVGEKNPMYGKPVSKETREKISKAGKGRLHTEESKEKIAAFHRGRKKSKEHKEKMSEAAFERFKDKTSHPRWKRPEDRKTSVYIQIRTCKEYHEWRISVYKRDNFTCMHCGKFSSGDLNADHIKPFALILKENNISSLEDALKCKELWDLDNGRTLCEECHKKTETYARQI